MKTLSNFINEALETPCNFSQECYFDWEEDDAALEALQKAIDEVNKMMMPRAEAGIDDCDDTVYFSIWGEDYDEVEEYGAQLIKAIDDNYKDAVDVKSGDIEEN